MDPWTSYWLAPVAAVRPWLILKITLFVLAFDVLHTHLGPAWRYGAGGFNVPHFAWMEALPIPTTAAYVGMLFFVSTSALVCALMPRPPRPLLIAIAVLYTWGWSCSMHDSYQHHYLISFLLLAIAMFPTLDGRTMFGDAPSPERAPNGLVPRVHALGYTLLTSACAVVYAYTAVSKTEPDWLSGDAMRSITHQGESIPGAIAIGESLGIEGDDFWWWLGHGVVPAQVICALAYAVAPLIDGPSTRDERERLSALATTLWARGGRGPAVVASGLIGFGAGVVHGFARGWGALGIGVTAVLLGAGGMVPFLDTSARSLAFAPVPLQPLRMLARVVAAIGLVTALSFHLGAEYITLAIGWFSYYMIAIALVAFLPARWLSLAAFAMTVPLRTRTTDWASPAMLPRIVLAVLAGGAALVVMGQLADVPGAVTASFVLVAVLVVITVASLNGGFSFGLLTRGDAFAYALATAVAGAALSGWVYVSPARFDYYRFAGGDFRRRLQYEDAVHAYERANRYAPPGESRDDRIEEMRAMIRERRGVTEQIEE